MHHHHYASIGSTNDQARALAAAHPGEPLVVTSAVQTAGRGRIGRPWQSPPGGLWMSVVWPATRGLEHYLAVPLIAALALHRGVQAVLPANQRPLLMIKWPNDLLLSGQKVAGVLCETLMQGESRAIIIGIGINANFPSTRLLDDLRFPATTLREHLGGDVDLSRLKDDILFQLIALLRIYEDQGLAEPLREELGHCLAFQGREVTLEAPGATDPAKAVRGRIAGLDPQGRLLLETRQGLRACDAGDLCHLNPIDP